MADKLSTTTAIFAANMVNETGGGGGGGDVTGVKGNAESTYRTGNVNITAANIGAYTSTETDTLLSGKISTTAKGVANGVAELDSNGKVPSSQLPSYVDDVINGYYKVADGKFYEESTYETEITGETGKIYVSLDTDKCYRWSGIEFVEISESLALGETSSTAYAGDKGKANADAITAIKDGLTIDSFGDVETALADKVDKVQGKGLSTNDYDATAKAKLDALANIQSIGTGLSLDSTTHELTATGGGISQVQADWTQADDTAVDYIKHKPTLGTAAAKDSTNAVTANSTDLVESGAVNTAVSKCNHVICAFSNNESSVSYAKIIIALGGDAANKSSTFMITTRSGETWLIGCTYANASNRVVKCTKVCNGENKIDAIKAALTYDNSIYTLTIFLKLQDWYNRCRVTTLNDETGSCTATVTSSTDSTEYDAFTNEASTSTVATGENYTTAEKTKLTGIATGATANTVIDTTCTLTVAGWTGNAAPYTQTVNVTGILSTDKAWCDLSVSSTVATGLDEIDDWALVSKIESGAGTLTFSCYEEKPTTELNVNVKVVR